MHLKDGKTMSLCGMYVGVQGTQYNMCDVRYSMYLWTVKAECVWYVWHWGRGGGYKVHRMIYNM